MEFISGATKIIYRIEERNDSGNSFIVGDVLGELTKYNKAVVIEDIYTEVASRGKGYAKSAVEHFVRLLSKEMPVLACSGILTKYFPIEPNDEEWDETLKWQREFLEKIGFTYINQYICYEFSEAFLYVNEDTKPFIDASEKRRLENKEMLDSVRKTDPFISTVRHILCKKMRNLDICDLLLFRDLYTFWDQKVERSAGDFKVSIANRKITISTDDGNIISCNINSADEAYKIFQPWLDANIKVIQDRETKKVSEISDIVAKATSVQEENNEST